MGLDRGTAGDGKVCCGTGEGRETAKPSEPIGVTPCAHRAAGAKRSATPIGSAKAFIRVYDNMLDILGFASLFVPERLEGELFRIWRIPSIR